MKKIFVFILLLSYNIFAQEFSIGLDYSRLITGKNYESVSIYTLGTDFEFEKYNFSVGVDLTAFVGDINFTALNHPSNLLSTFKESAPTLRINLKYYPSFLKDLSKDVKPYFVIALGKELITKPFRLNKNMITFCEEDFSFTNKMYYYSNFGIGSIFFPTQPLSFIFELKYQLSNPTITYERGNCSGNLPEYSYSSYTEKINLNMLFWNFGFRINF